MKSQLREDMSRTIDYSIDFDNGVRMAQNIRYQLQEDLSSILPLESSSEEFRHYE